MDWFDRAIFRCLKCGHIWIIGSDKMLTEKELDRWVKEFMKEHLIIHREQKRKGKYNA